MSAVFTEADMDRLALPFVARAWLGEFDFPRGVQYLHSGTGRVTIDGHEFIGVSDPANKRLVGVGQIEEPQFGAAAAVAIVLSAPSKELIQQVYADARDIEGRAATIYFAQFDAETQARISQLVPMIRHGKMSAPSIEIQGLRIRQVSLTVENIWSAHNYAPGGRWSPADMERRFAGDKGGAFIGVKIPENWT